eukprot:TRINITY_DN6656_c0_g2_i1.p1 TRINITY_DN6656_c0_g2~~TRINITY_DN6656_c0_g2_i1.p1  ORF type:complete len:503 (+),score=81.00 TRINITY_DN6656_c0_g2_i1:99-1607(+)
MSDEDDDMQYEDEYDEVEVYDDEVGVYDDEGGLEKSLELTKHKSYEVLSEEQLLSQSKAIIKEVTEVLDIPTKAACTILLRHFKWNKEKLIEKYMSSSDKVKKEAGITSFDTEKKPDPKVKKFDCLICLDSFPSGNTFALACGHRYCSDCWRQYLEIKIQGADCVWTHCPSPGCKEQVHELAFKKLVTKPLYQNYKRFLLRSLVEDNPQIKFCPAPGCTNCIRCDRRNRKEAVVCNCGFQFCFMCSDSEIGDHMPATCKNVEDWSVKSQDESENVKWMIANTKKCPKCRSPIEKNGGCMHMTCRKDSGGCGYEFCWLCRGVWSEHGAETGGYYACNKYDVSKAKEEDVKANDIKTELETYMFYYHRYESHRNAMKIADEQRRVADKRANQIVDKFGVRAQDTKFLMEATEQLLKNRRVLQWSYVFGFYLDKKKTAEKSLFEYLQEDLEKHTNTLSTWYEKALDTIADYQAFMSWKETVTNLTRVTAKFLDKFVEGVSEGLTS